LADFGIHPQLRVSVVVIQNGLNVEVLEMSLWELVKPDVPENPAEPPLILLILATCGDSGNGQLQVLT
jgi:hypothetical protein